MIALAVGTAALAALLTLPINETSGAVPVATDDVAAPAAPQDVDAVPATAEAPRSCEIPPSRSGQIPVATDSAEQARFYEGPSASRTYDQQWKKAFPIPHLDAYVPQGMTTWTNWNGKGDDLILIGLYRGPKERGEQSVIAAVDPRSGDQYGAVRVRNSHLGGIAVAGDFLFTQDRATKTTETVRRYRLSTLESALKKSNSTGDIPFIGMLKETQEIYAADFMTVHNGRVWAGRYSEHAPDRMYEYTVSAKGKLSPVGTGWPIPPRTQGALVSDDAFVFNSSNHAHHGVMVIADKSRSESRRTVCFASPSMGEGMTLVGDRAFNLFEGGSYKYTNALNRIDSVHEASMRSLERLIGE